MNYLKSNNIIVFKSGESKAMFVKWEIGVRNAKFFESKNYFSKIFIQLIGLNDTNRRSFSWKKTLFVTGNKFLHSSSFHTFIHTLEVKSCRH